MENRLQRIKVLLGASTALVLAACSGAAQGPPKTTSVNVLSSSYGKLQFAVGTANLFEGAYTGLNVVSTFRQTNGTSAVLVDTPSITGPFTLPAAQPASGGGVGDSFSTAPAGPSYIEVTAGGELTGTPQSLRTGSVACDPLDVYVGSVPANPTTGCPAGYTPNITTFGQSGGVFGMGLQPSNSTNNGVPYSYTPYPEPNFDASGYAFLPWGGPPAYDPDGHGMGARDGISNLGAVDGVNEGLTTFEGVTPATGTYTLSLQIPTGISSSGQASYGTLSATAALSSLATLGNISSPPLVEDGLGGGTLTTGPFPAGVTEEIIQIADYGPDYGTTGSFAPNCQGTLDSALSGTPVVYTLIVKTPGTVTLPDAIGPNLDYGQGAGHYAPAPTLCTAAQSTNYLGAATDGDYYTIQSIGVDYPAYEANPIFGGETPTIVGANGQADITIAVPIANAAYGAGGGFTAIHRKPGSVRRSSTILRPAVRK